MDIWDRLLKAAQEHPEDTSDPPDIKRLRAKCDIFPEASFERSSAFQEYLDMSRYYHEARWARLKEIKKPPAKSEKDQTEAEPRWYFGTFTQPDSEGSDPTLVLSNTVKVIKSKMISPVIEWCYSLELTEKGIPHTHYAFLTTRRPTCCTPHKDAFSPKRHT